MKKFYILIIFSLLFSFMAKAQDEQDTVRSLIFTEWRGDAWPMFYTELTNVGEDTLDLSRFTFMNLAAARVWPTNPNATLRLWGKLNPGQSWVMMPVYDEPNIPTGRPVHRTQMVPIARESGLIVHQIEAAGYQWEYDPENEMWGKDSIDPYNEITRYWLGTYSAGLWYILDNGDSVLVDAVNNAPEGTNYGNDPKSVAGVEDATYTHTLFRKATVKEGNLNWDQARGVDLGTSEWIPVPHGGYNYDGDIFTTVGNHGDYHIYMTPPGSVTVDEENARITVPWGTQKMDSLVRLLNFGPGMAWNYIEDTLDFEDGAHTIAQNGDILQVYAIGNTLEQIDFEIAIGEPADDMVEVFPLRNLIIPTEEEIAEGEVPEWGGTRYYVTEDQPVIDSIGDVPFDVRVDTLFKYLEWAPNASAEIVWVDGKERVDLKNGDLLRITGGDGTTTKDYYIDVQPYDSSENAYLSAIIWPDKPGYLDGWTEDTIPDFKPTFQSYTVTMPYGTTNIPALVAIPEDPNAIVEEDRAVSLSGGVEERTTTFTVTAEDDSTVLVYKVTFEINLTNDLVQEYTGEPFISELVLHQHNWNCFIEIKNPGNQELDLSQYMIVNGEVKNPAEAIQNIVTGNTVDDYNDRYQRAYVPGYKFSGDTAQWQLAPGKLYYDAIVDPIVEPGGVFVIAQAHHREDRVSDDIVLADVVLSDGWANTWGETDIDQRSVPNLMSFNENALFLFEILNDSILEGTKEIEDPADFRLIDIFGDPETDVWNIAGRTIPVSVRDQTKTERKPHVYKGVTILGEGFGTNAEDSDWEVVFASDEGWNNNRISESIGSHPIDPVTIYRSTVSSLVYIVDDGFEGELDILGISSGETVQQFFDNIIKADPDQILHVISTDDGSEKELTENVAENDTLMVVSADQTNTTKYVLSTTPLDNNATLTAVSGSGLVVNIDGATGSISGFDLGTNVSTILEGVEKPETAILNVINGEDNLVALHTLKTDSTESMTTASDNIYFEVIAQDGVTIITYQLQPAVSESDAYILSDVYTVLQDSSAVTGIITGTSVSTFYNNIILSDGATAKILKKNTDERETGALSHDDKLVVTSADSTVVKVYYLQFYDEIPGMEGKLRSVPEAPSTLALINVSATGTEATIEWVDNSEFENGFIILRDGVVIDTVQTNTFTDEGLVKSTTYLYEVYAYNELGVSEKISLSVITFPTSVEGNKNSLSIYPTVTRDYVYITGLTKGNRVTVTNVLGKIISDRIINDNETVVNLQAQPEGIYFISVLDNKEGLTLRKVVRE